MIRGMFVALLGLGLMVGSAMAGDVVIPPPAEVREELPPPAPIREEVRVEHHSHDVHCAYGVSEHFTLVLHKDAGGHWHRSYIDCAKDTCSSSAKKSCGTAQAREFDSA